MRSVISCLVLLVSACLAADVRGYFQPTAHLDAVTSLSPSTVLRLTDGRHEYTTSFLTSGEFVFRNVEASEYVLRVICGSHTFKPVKVVVRSGVPSQDSAVSPSTPLDQADEVTAFRLVRGQAWSVPTVPLPYPLVVRAEGVVEYYDKRPTLDPLTILKNPMALIGIFMALSVFGLPALTKLLDPDGVEEMERIKREKAEQQRQARADEPVVDNPVEKFTNFDVSGWLAGKK